MFFVPQMSGYSEHKRSKFDLRDFHELLKNVTETFEEEVYFDDMYSAS